MGAAARAVMPHLQKTLAEKTTLDLKPFLGDAQKMVAAAISVAVMIGRILSLSIRGPRSNGSGVYDRLSNLRADAAKQQQKDRRPTSAAAQ